MIRLFNIKFKTTLTSIVFLTLCFNTTLFAIPLYSVSFITSDESVTDLHIGNDGHITWTSHRTEGDQIRQYSNGAVSTVYSLDPDRFGSRIRVNNHGQVVFWSGNDAWEPEDVNYAVHYYDGSTTFTIDEPDNDEMKPNINDDGKIVYMSRINEGDFDLFTFDGSTTTKITDASTYDYEGYINNNGHIAWSAEDEVYYFDGINITNITNSEAMEFVNDINNQGQLLWNGHLYGSTGYQRRDYFHNGSNVRVLTEKFVYWKPALNDNGRVTWLDSTDSQQATPSSEIYLFNGINTHRLTDNNIAESRPIINNNNFVVWKRNSDLMLYDNQSSGLVTTGIWEFDINDNNCLTWSRKSGAVYKIYKACPTRRESVRTGRVNMFNESICDMIPKLCFLIQTISLTAPCKKIPEIPCWEGRMLMENNEITCPDCMFSEMDKNQLRPLKVRELYLNGKNYISSKTPGHKNRKLKDLLTKAAEGSRYSRKVKLETVKKLARLEKNKSSINADSRIYVSSLNAIELDWRVPKIKPVKVNKGKDVTINLNGVARLVFSEVKQAQTLSLNVKSQLPYAGINTESGWPGATYDFSMSGTINEQVTISLYYGGIKFKSKDADLRMYQRKDNQYHDITTVIDPTTKTITGSVESLSKAELTIMAPLKKKGKNFERSIKKVKSFK